MREEVGQRDDSYLRIINCINGYKGWIKGVKVLHRKIYHEKLVNLHFYPIIVIIKRQVI